MTSELHEKYIKQYTAFLLALICLTAKKKLCNERNSKQLRKNLRKLHINYTLSLLH